MIISVHLQLRASSVTTVTIPSAKGSEERAPSRPARPGMPEVSREIVLDGSKTDEVEDKDKREIGCAKAVCPSALSPFSQCR